MNDLYKLLRKRTFTVKTEGFSMFPLLQPGDLLIVKPVKIDKIRLNDLITFKKKKRLLTHSVIYKRGNIIISKGLNNFKSDGHIRTSQLIGRVLKIVRQGLTVYPKDYFTIQSLAYRQEIIRLKKKFQALAIEFVILKGLPLYLYLYHRHPSRFYSDCDILIFPTDLLKVNKMLTENNYILLETSITGFQKLLKKRIFPTHNKTCVTYVKKIKGISVRIEVHIEASYLLNHQLGTLSSLYPQKLMNELTSKFMKEKRIISVDGEFYTVLSNQNLIIYLALHLYDHNFKGAFRYDLLDKVISYEKKINWDKIGDTIKYYRFQNFLYPVYILLKKNYSSPIPLSFIEKLKPEGWILNFILNYIIKNSIFNYESRFFMSIYRLRNTFIFSSEPVFKKILTFFYPLVLINLIWAIYKLLFPAVHGGGLRIKNSLKN